MSTQRVIIDSQSNPLFIGIPLEQAYDQRGGLCEVGNGDIVVCTSPIDPLFLEYWESLGMSLPTIISAPLGYQDHMSISDHVIQNTSLQQEILAAIPDPKNARLEFFWISERERSVVHALGIQAYCSFDYSLQFSSKQAFKELAEVLDIPTPTWASAKSPTELWERGTEFLQQEKPFLVKANTGTGGIALGGMYRIETKKQLRKILSKDGLLAEGCILEEIIDKVAEFSVHLEAPESGKVTILGVFDQGSNNFGYDGASWPVSQFNEQKIREITERTLAQHLQRQGVVGFYCVDVVMDKLGNHYWIDFNPRKGAIWYTYALARRASKHLYSSEQCLPYVHEHIILPPRSQKPWSVKEVLSSLGDWKKKGEDSTVIVSNPGVIRFGYLDLTCISKLGKEHARTQIEQARQVF